MLMIVIDVTSEQPLQVRFVDGNHVVQQFAAATSDPSFCDTILPRTANRGTRSQRSVPSSAKAVQILAASKPAVVNPEALVFATRTGTPFDRHNLSTKRLKPTCKKLNLVGVSWHWLRHANATLLDAVGTPLGTVQALLGHSSSEITREVYLHSIPADARAAVEKVEEMLNRPKLTQVVENWKTRSSLIQ
jgi:integrase